MGMYTEIFITCGFVDDLPDDVVNILKCLFDNGEEPEVLPDHPFFEHYRWSMIGRCSSFYFVPESTSRLFYNEISNSYYVTSRSDLKNYSGEIEDFFDWIMPYVEMEEGEFFGYSRYEEDNLPKLYVKRSR